jgi:DDE superfamily endonuclease
METVLTEYVRPYDPKYPSVNMDETSKQLVAETRPRQPARPGMVERYDFEYERNGVANLFLFTEPLRGWRMVAVTDRRTKTDWAEQVRILLDEVYPDAERVTVVCDNLNTHTPGALYAAFPPEEARRLLDRLEILHTPKHGSWLNIAEIELSVLSRQCLADRIPTATTLAEATTAWSNRRNAEGNTVTWRFTTADARIKLKHLYPAITP